MQGDFPVNDPSAVKIWSKNVEVAEREYAEIAPLIGSDANSIIQERSELEKGPGDQVKFTLRAVLQGAGFSEGETAEGNGEALTFSQDSIIINELGHTIVTPSENTIDAQRVPFNLRAEGRDGLGEWWGNRKAVSIFNQLCGYTPANTVSPTSGPKFTGLNPVIAPTSGAGLIRHIWPGAITSDEALTSTETFTTAVIDRAVTRAILGHQRIKPVMVNGQPRWVMYIHPVQVEQLRTNAGAGGWLDIQKQAIAGAGKHGIYNGALGEWNRVVLRSSQSVTNGVNSSTGAVITNVKRAVLLGAQAAVCAYGRKTNPAKSKYRWSEEIKDHGRRLEVGAWGIFGCKKAQFNTPNLSTGAMVPVDYGTLVVSTWAPNP
jgi:N4-gp56 family major capsid protein